ncbi:discoidin domain-containing protein [Akkermansiaceae bacterium]|nr:discoidin domain-containing protein [Akkermansiaceae bacterium]
MKKPLSHLAAVIGSILLFPPAHAKLIGHWTFDEASGTAIGDSSGMGNPGTLVNPQPDTWITGIHGSALYFPGTTGSGSTRVDIPDSDSLRTANAITFAAWVRCDDINRDGPILAKERSGANSYWFGVNNRSAEGAVAGNFGVLLSANGSWNLADRNQGTIPEGAWVHLASTWDGTTVRHYLNGSELPETNTFTGPISPSSALLAIGVNSVHRNYAFKGAVDDLRIYDEALSPAEIIAISKPPFPLAGLLAHYPLDGNADDTSGNGNHGTVNGATPSDDADGHANGCFRFDGNDSIDIPGFTGNHPTGTFAAWVTADGYDTGFNQLNLIFGQNDNLQIGLGDSSIGADGQWVLRHRSDGGFVNPAGPLPNLGRWTHVAGVWTETEAILYLDGVEVSHVANGTLVAGAPPAKLGSHPFAAQNYWKGKIDDVFLYDRALDLAEIQLLASAHPTDFGLSLSPQGVPVSAAALEWNSTPGARFRVWDSEDLKAWNPGALIIGPAGQNRVSHTAATASAPTRFYRVERLLGSGWNLALGKAITTNASYPNQGVELAIDGDRATQWSSTDHGSAGDPNWLKLDLGRVQEIGRVFLWFVYNNGQYPNYTNVYELYGSQDDSDYTLIATGTLVDTADYEGRSDDIILPVDARSYRYLLYNVVGGSHWSGLNEFEVYPPGY